MFSKGVILYDSNNQDPDCPGVVEETKYWVLTAQTKTDTTDVEWGPHMVFQA